MSRIALVTESFDPRLSGTAGTVRQVADRLVATGHEVRILTAGTGPTAYHGMAVSRFASPRRGHQVRESLLGFRPDLVHAFTPGSVGTRALRHARRLGIPTVVTETSPRAEFAPTQWRDQVADRADRLTVTATWLARALGGAGLPADTWSPGVDLDVFSPSRRDQALRASWTDGDLTQVVVGYVGGLRKRHGVRRLAEVAAIPGTRLVVIGDGPQQSWLRRRLPASVRFTGELKPRHAAVAIASLDLLVHPGTTATCGHVLREAAACGVPCVAPRAGGAPDVVRHLETGLLTEPADPLGLADAVAALVGDKQRRKMGEHARVLAEQRSWGDAVDELVARHYLPLLGVRVSPAA